MKKKIWLALIVSWHAHTHCFSTLETLQKYADSYQEFPKPDNQNWLDADFSTYHHSIKGGIIDRVLRWVGWKTNGIWNDAEFESLLMHVTKQRKISGRLVQTIICPTDSKFFIFGDLHGAFHSLVRDLSWMKHQGILDNSFKILNPNNYLVFNGDAIDRSPYTLETLHTMILLMKANPNNVVYIRGNHEKNSHWINFGLKRELEIRSSRKSNLEVPLKKEIDAFFDTLPLALFITTPEDLNKAIRISHPDREDKELSFAEVNLDEYFKNTKEGLITHKIKKNYAKKNTAVDIIAVIETQPWRHEVKGINGLNRLEQDRGAAAWSVLSSPIEAHQDFLDFYFDAFAQLTIKQPLVQSTIAIYNHDIRKKNEPFVLAGTYNLVSGMPITNETQHSVPEKPFIIGSTMALKKGLPILGQRVKRGLSTRINQANKQGGVHGKHIRAIVYNDDYIPHRARPNVDLLMERDKTDIIILPVGTPTLESYDEYAKNGKVLVLFPVTGAPEFRNSVYKYLVNFRNTYADEVVALIDHMVDIRAARKFAFFYQDDAFGGAPLLAAQQALKSKGIKKWTELPYLRGSTDFKAQVQKIRQAQPDAIGFFSTAQATREFMRMLGVDFLANKQLFGISFLGEESFRKYVKKQGLSVLLGAVVPNPNTSELPIAKEYRKLMDELKYPYDVFSFEAYIATSILLDALEKIKPPFTKEKILSQLESLRNYDFKGLPLTFNPETRSLIPYIWLESGSNEEWIRKEISHKPLPATEMQTPSTPAPKANELKALPASKPIKKTHDSVPSDTAQKNPTSEDHEKHIQHQEKPEEVEKELKEKREEKEDIKEETNELFSNI